MNAILDILHTVVSRMVASILIVQYGIGHFFQANYYRSRMLVDPGGGGCKDYRLDYLYYYTDYYYVTSRW